MFLIGLSYVDCTQTALAVVLLVLAVTVSGFVYSGYFVNHMDIAPQYAGTLMGISNGISAISGIIAPYVAAIVTESVSKLGLAILFPIAAIFIVLARCGTWFITRCSSHLTTTVPFSTKP